jgi:hypothetical protein
VWYLACNPDHVASIANGIAIAVETQMPKVICMSFARGSKFTVTTAMIATRKPREVNISDTGVLWYMAREIAVGIEPLINCQRP